MCICVSNWDSAAKMASVLCADVDGWTVGR